MKLGEIVVDGAIITELRATERDEVIAEIVDALIGAGAAPVEVRAELISAVLERESKGTTGFGKGVAVPHVKHRAVSRMAAGVALAPRGIEFSSMDKQPVYSVFLLLSPDNKPEEHLQAMEVIFRNLSKETFRRFLRQASSLSDVKTLIDDADNQTI